MTRFNVEAMRRLVERYRRVLEQSNGRAEGYAVRIARSVDGRIARAIVQGGERPIDRGRINELLRAVKASIGNGDAEINRLLSAHAPDVIELSLREAESAVSLLEGVDRWNAISDTRIVDTFASFERDIAEHRLLDVTAPYLERWRAEWNDGWTTVARRVQADFTRGMLTGQTNDEIAAGLVDPLNELNIRGRIPPEDFARAFIRTKSGELYQDAGLKIAMDAGLDQFVNLGVPDNRQSEVCFLASQAGAHTLEWWEASEFGPPKRHVFNCRCHLQAVTARAAKRDWTQPNPKFEKEKVSA